MRRLLQVAKATWVHPDAIQAIEWSAVNDCPKIHLDSGATVSAMSFHERDPALREARTKELLEALAEFPEDPVRHDATLQATTERAEAFDFDSTPIGFVTSKGRS